MHLPDHMLDPVTCAAAAAVSAGALGYAVYRVRGESQKRLIPLLGVTAAVIFAAQMLNFPVAGGTSGHILGGALAAILLGPWAGLLAVASVLVVQCLLFGDGGAAALGANILNMGVIGSLGGYAIYHQIQKRLGGWGGTLTAAAAASWLSVMAAAGACAIELAISGEFALLPTLGAMLSVHSLIALGEAAATVTAVAAVASLRPELIYRGSEQPSSPFGLTRVVIPGLAIALATAALLSPFASSSPDGLESTVAALGFRGETGSLLASPWADYSVAAFEQMGAAGSAAGVIGVLAVFGLALACGWSSTCFANKANVPSL